MSTLPYQEIASAMATAIRDAWATEESLTAVFERCHRGPKFDRTDHGRAIVERIFLDAWEAALPQSVPNAWDRLSVARALTLDLWGDYNLITQVVPNVLPVPLQIRQQAFSTAVQAAQQAFEGRTDVPNPFKEKRPKIKVTAATHSPEVVADYVKAQALAKASSILGADGFSNLSFRVSPLGKTPAFSDSMSYGQLPALADSYVEVLPSFQKEGWESLYVSWGKEGTGMALTQGDDGVFTAVSLPKGYNRFVSESGGEMLAMALGSRFLAGTILWAWARAADLHGVAVIPRLSSFQVIGPKSFLDKVESMLPLINGVPMQASRGARAPLPAE